MKRKSNTPSAFTGGDDGMTVTRYIEAFDRLTPAMRVTFRAVSYGQQLEDEAAVEKMRQLADEATAHRTVCGCIAERIIRWQVIDRDGVVQSGTPEPTQDNVARLMPYLFRRLSMMVWTQLDGGDRDEHEPEAETTSAAEHKATTAGN